MTNSRLHLGTSSWSSKDWVGPFYPPKTKPGDFISHYAEVYRTVEVDATFYRIPSERAVDAWRSKTPDGFKFAVKTPRVITHDKILVDAEDDMKHFIDIFGYFNNHFAGHGPGSVELFKAMLARVD